MRVSSFCSVAGDHNSDNGLTSTLSPATATDMSRRHRSAGSRTEPVINHPLQPQKPDLWEMESNASDRGINIRASQSPAFPSSGLIHRLFPAIIEERSRTRQRHSWMFLAGDADLQLPPPPSSKQKWGDIFFDNFVPSCVGSQNSELQDDLLFIVKKVPKVEAGISSMETVVDVIRRENIAKLPAPNDPEPLWDETVYLNLLLNHLEYVVTCAVCSRSTPKDLQIIRRKSTRVFASPSRRRMDSKGESEEMSYPNLFFSIDDFEDIFKEVIVRDGEMVCVELVAKDPLSSSIKSVLFLGSVRYELLKQVYDGRASLTNKMTEKWWSSTQRTEFVRMKGPQGRGYAEMAVSRVQGSKPSTPSNDEDSEFDFGDMEEQLNMSNRRASDQFRGITSSSRHNTPHDQYIRKSQSEAFGGGSMGGKYGDEVQAGRLQDEVEEGALYSQWGFRGINQAWHWYKERRRNGSIALNAHLTYVTLPWHVIINALLEEKTQPVLTDF